MSSLFHYFVRHTSNRCRILFEVSSGEDLLGKIIRIPPILGRTYPFLRCIHAAYPLFSSKIGGIRDIFRSKSSPDETSNTILHRLLVCLTKSETFLLVLSALLQSSVLKCLYYLVLYLSTSEQQS